jgi:ATP-binding cassette subfamily B protein
MERLSRLVGRALGEKPERGRRCSDIRGIVEFQKVSFTYPERHGPALNRVGLHIAALETVAFIGPNGAGKSTLAHLLMRLHEPTEGAIFIGGIDISTVSLHSLRGQIGVVPQHVLLLDATVRDSIAYSRADSTQEQIESVAKAARAHDFISRLPQGYETIIGDRGVRLSGGAKAAARASPGALERSPDSDPRRGDPYVRSGRRARILGGLPGDVATEDGAPDHSPAGEPGTGRSGVRAG